eukprot:SAG31_NODE_1374_length_8594_cov_57.759623_4_plen_896_part_00
MSGSARTDPEDDSVLQITQLENSQSGEAYFPIPGLQNTDGLIVRYQMYSGDGSGADGQCVNVGTNTLGGRNGEDGVPTGVAVCFDEWANEVAEHGIQIFYNGEMVYFNGAAHCENQAGCAPVSYFADGSWHWVELQISSETSGSAHVRFSLDHGRYAGTGIIDGYVLPDFVYLGFTGRTGGATNNHWVKSISAVVGQIMSEDNPRPAVLKSAFEFPARGVGITEFERNDVAVANLNTDTLEITPVEGSKEGTAFSLLPGLSALDQLTVRFLLYTGDGSGGDGLCVNVGGNSLGDDEHHRHGEDGVERGVALCFDEWADEAEHGIQIYYDGILIMDGSAHCENQGNCPPVSYFADGTWHAVEMNISPDADGAADITFDLDTGVYSGHGIINEYSLDSDVYLGFTGRTGGATNNHWVKDVSVAVTPRMRLEFASCTQDESCSDCCLSGSARTDPEDDSVLQITQLQNSQSGEAYFPIPGLQNTDGFIVSYQMYTGDGSGADGQCVNVGTNTLGGRNGEDGVGEGVAVCFDEWANDVAEHGIQIFYNGEMVLEGRAACENQDWCAPVSYFADGSYHDVQVIISPDGHGGAAVTFELDRGVYGGQGIINDYNLPQPVYLGFTGRTGGATNNHWVKDVLVSRGRGQGGGSCHSGLYFEAYAIPSDTDYGNNYLHGLEATVFSDRWDASLGTPVASHEEHTRDIWYDNDAAFVREIDGFQMTDNYAMRWRGQISILTEGAYQFKTSSDDGSMLYVDGIRVVDNDGDHGIRDVTSRDVSLTPGMHDIVITFYEHGGGSRLQVSWKTPGSEEFEPLGGNVLSNSVGCAGATSTTACSATLYQHGGYQGWHHDFPEGDFALAQVDGARTNDASSLVVTGDGSCRVTVYGAQPQHSDRGAVCVRV